ncbi:PIN domain-containing protein [Micromonospora sp. C28SCA-DRY-2]|uniref:PIN domain-containing protein n=1 Tax=Micromonospora sp. C28SCA-DRY-2 TaxID=3059522 RepID=UPI002674A410|nr:PIN domain-containing protein [Micromonospora sp. C28SCA-DRY-2]MDO3700296.1 PIN domain-containing protein [Micromonospora sp. C28SCA-DRY-2]
MRLEQMRLPDGRQLPGVDRNNLHASLASLLNTATIIRGGTSRPMMRPVFSYLDWANEVRRQLRNQGSAADLDRLAPADRYQLLLSTAASLQGDQLDAERVLNGLLAMELDERISAFTEANAGVKSQVKQFERAGRPVVLDSNVHLHHPQKLEELDLAPALGTRYDPIHILVPMIVVDELALKQHSKAHNRSRIMVRDEKPHYRHSVRRFARLMGPRFVGAVPRFVDPRGGPARRPLRGRPGRAEAPPVVLREQVLLQGVAPG